MDIALSLLFGALVGFSLGALGAGGSTELRLDAGLAHAHRRYLLLGTTAGTDPGLSIGPTVLPINPTGAYFLHTAQSPNAAPLVGSMGLLDAAGMATASFALPPGVSPSASGITLHHAYVVLDESDSVVFASNAVPLTLAP